MSTKKKKPATKRRVQAHVRAFVKRWGRAPDKSDLRFYARAGRWPSKAEFAFWDTNRRFPKPGELARLTREAKQRLHEARRIAAKRGWEKRRLKSDEVRKWERARRALQAAQVDEIARAEKTGIKRPLRAHRWYDHFYISLSLMSVDEIYALLLAMKRRGVKAFRIEREVAVGEYREGITPAGYASTKFQFMSRLSENELLHGNSRTGLPALVSMRAPGIDFMRQLVVSDDDMRDYFPPDIVKKVFRLKRETRETLKNPDDQSFYLIKGKRPNARQQRRMRDLRKLIDAGLDDEDDDDEEAEE